MAYFEYNGKTTDNIISTPLILVVQDGLDEIVTTRSKIEGERTISRYVTNEYGTIYDSLSFQITLMKDQFKPPAMTEQITEDMTQEQIQEVYRRYNERVDRLYEQFQDTFTTDEQITIERWLLSPKYSQELMMVNCDNEYYWYLGLFTSVEWDIANNGYMFCKATFQVNGAYPFKHNSWGFQSENTGTETTSEHTLTCDSHEIEEYIYPYIRIIPYESTGSNDQTITIVNLTDDANRVFKVQNHGTNIMEIDCNGCGIYQSYEDGGNYKITKQYKFSEVGLGTNNTIYWPRIVSGKNTIRITANARIYFLFNTPFKKAGGWLA